jgi:hypothetical protein
LIVAASVATLPPADSSTVGLIVTRWIGFGDVFAATTLYHLVGWLVFLSQRARHGGEVARTHRRLLGVHAIPAAICVLLLSAPEAMFTSLREAVFSPVLYLFWSALHVAQTLVIRQRAAR